MIFRLFHPNDRKRHGLEKGQGMIEFALISAFFFGFLLVLGSLVQILYYFIGINFTMSQASRHLRGETSTAIITSKIVSEAHDIGINLNPAEGDITVTIDASHLVTIKANKKITVNPLTGILLDVTGFSHGGDYYIKTNKSYDNDIDVHAS